MQRTSMASVHEFKPKHCHLIRLITPYTFAINKLRSSRKINQYHNTYNKVSVNIRKGKGNAIKVCQYLHKLTVKDDYVKI
jgi:hypothetical protein